MPPGSKSKSSCEPKDSNACLKASPDFRWGCWWNRNNCDSWGKSVRRCCPETCGTGEFTEEDCNAFDGKGDCIYPNEAQCSIDGN